MTEAAQVKVFQALDNNSIEPEFIENIAKDINKIVDEESYLSQVKEFMLTSGQEVRKYPSYPDLETCKLRIRLVDLQYVLSGAVQALGFGGIFDEAFEEVQASNMSKFVTSEEDVNASIQKYKELGIEVKAVYGEQYTVIVRSKDNKVLKGIHFKEPKLDKLIIRAIEENELRDS